MKSENREHHQLSTQDIISGLKNQLAQQRKGLKTLRGDEFIKSLNEIDAIIGSIQRVEDSILPSTPGLKAIGTATYRAAHGGTLEPGNRSNR